MGIIGKVLGKVLIAGQRGDGQMAHVAVDDLGQLKVVGAGVATSSDIRLKDENQNFFAAVTAQGRVKTEATVIPVANAAASGNINGVGGSVTLVAGTGQSGFVIVITETAAFTGTVVFEGSSDGGVTWFSRTVRKAGVTTSLVTQAITGDFPFEGRGNMAGMDQIRVRCTARTGGTLQVHINAGVGTGGTFLGAELPAGTQNIGDVDVASAPTLESRIDSLLALMPALTLTARMKAGQPTAGYRIWSDTADANYIYLAEAVLAQSDQTQEAWRGIRIPKDANGNLVGEWQESTAFRWDNKTSTTGWS